MKTTTKTKSTIVSLAASVMAVTLISAANAQISTSTANESSSFIYNPMVASSAAVDTRYAPISDSTVLPTNWLDQPGTGPLQEKVLMKINAALINGSLSAADATTYKAQLNKLNDRESSYKSVSKAIPADVTSENLKVLNDMSKAIEGRPRITASQSNALHADIDELISSSLAHNKISSSEAETYYLRLAQIESNLESAKSNPAELSEESALMNNSLRQIKAELVRR